MIADDRKYTEEHEWVLVEGEIGTVGVTEYAASELGDVVFVELPDLGSEYSAGDTAGTIESVKAVADLYVPVSGEVVEVNGLIDSNPELLNSDPMEEGWLVKVQLADTAEVDKLMTAAEYEDLLGG